MGNYRLQSPNITLKGLAGSQSHGSDSGGNRFSSVSTAYFSDALAPCLDRWVAPKGFRVALKVSGWHERWVARKVGGTKGGWHERWVARKVGGTKGGKGGWHQEDLKVVGGTKRISKIFSFFFLSHDRCSPQTGYADQVRLSCRTSSLICLFYKGLG
jgi:hypothetical protein